MIRPLLADMTKSELHAVMTGGFATVAGCVLAAYILFGVRLNDNTRFIELIYMGFVHIHTHAHKHTRPTITRGKFYALS